jgi:hypothetical protein
MSTKRQLTGEEESQAKVPAPNDRTLKQPNEDEMGEFEDMWEDELESESEEEIIDGEVIDEEDSDTGK